MYNDIKTQFERTVKAYAKKARGRAEDCIQEGGKYTINVRVREYDKTVKFSMPCKGGKITILANGKRYQL